MKRKAKMSPTWKAEPHLERLASCAIMLHLHGVIGDREYHRARERIERRWLKEQKLLTGGTVSPTSSVIASDS